MTKKMRLRIPSAAIPSRLLIRHSSFHQPRRAVREAHLALPIASARRRGEGNAVGKRGAMPYLAAMENATETEKPSRVLRWRMFWFLAGAGVNYLLIATP